MSEEQTDLTSLIQFTRFDTTSDTSDPSFDFPELKWGEPIIKKYTNPVTSEVRYVLYIGDQDGNPVQVGQSFVPIHDIFDDAVHTWDDFGERSMIPISTDSSGVMEARRLRFNDMSGPGLRHTMAMHTSVSNAIMHTRSHDQFGLFEQDEADLQYIYDDVHKDFGDWTFDGETDANAYVRSYGGEWLDDSGNWVGVELGDYTGANYNVYSLHYDERNPFIELGDPDFYFLSSRLIVDESGNQMYSREQRDLFFKKVKFVNIVGELPLERVIDDNHNSLGEVVTITNVDGENDVIPNSLMIIKDNNSPYRRTKLYTDTLEGYSNPSNCIFLEFSRPDELSSETE